MYDATITALSLLEFVHAHIQGVGDSGQGVVNAFLFVLLTKQVRDSFLQLFCCRRQKQQQLTEEAESSDTTHLVTEKPDARLSTQIAHYPFADSDTATPDPVTA